MAFPRPSTISSVRPSSHWSVCPAFAAIPKGRKATADLPFGEVEEGPLIREGTCGRRFSTRSPVPGPLGLHESHRARLRCGSAPASFHFRVRSQLSRPFATPSGEERPRRRDGPNCPSAPPRLSTRCKEVSHALPATDPPSPPTLLAPAAQVPGANHPSAMGDPVGWRAACRSRSVHRSATACR